MPQIHFICMQEEHLNLTKGFKANRRIEFKNDDLLDIQLNFPFYLERITPVITRSENVKYENESNQYTVRAVGPANQYMEKSIMMLGRYINATDVSEKNKNIVIGRKVAIDLFDQKNPIGKYVSMGSSAYKIVGVFQDAGGDNEERYIYMPYTTRQLIEKNNDKINEIVLSFRPEIGSFGALEFERKLRLFLKKKKSIDPTDTNGIFIRNVAEDLNRNQQFSNVLQLIVTFVGIGTLIAGIIGISNIMVFVVRERTKELGVRKALGASPRSVTAMILQESIFITLISGYVGMLTGILILNNLGLILEDYFIKNPYINISTAIFSTVILVIFGGIAGYIPAKRAASIKPIIALRDE